MQNYPSYGRRRAKQRLAKALLIAAIVLVLIIGAGTAFIVWPLEITREQATQIALTHVGNGTPNWPELDFENFQRVWNVEVFYNGFVHSVYVSRATGQVVRVELDRWD